MWILRRLERLRLRAIRRFQGVDSLFVAFRSQVKNYFRPYLSIPACAIEAQHSNDNCSIIFIDIIAPKWIRALLKLAYFLSRDLSSTPGYLA